jgi:hypothetical protein
MKANLKDKTDVGWKEQTKRLKATTEPTMTIMPTLIQDFKGLLQVKGKGKAKPDLESTSGLLTFNCNEVASSCLV